MGSDLYNITILPLSIMILYYKIAQNIVWTIVKLEQHITVQFYHHDDIVPLQNSSDHIVHNIVRAFVQ